MSMPNGSNFTSMLKPLRWGTACIPTPGSQVGLLQLSKIALGKNVSGDWSMTHSSLSDTPWVWNHEDKNLPPYLPRPRERRVYSWVEK